MDAINYWTQIVSESDEVDTLYVGRYIHAPRFPEGLGEDDDHRQLAENAHQSALREDKPYWDSLLRIAARKGMLNAVLLARASKSHPQKMHLFPIAASEIRTGALRRLIEQSNTDEVVVMASKVRLVNGQTKHIPMMDLRCQVDTIPLRSVEQLAKWLLPSGFALFASGRSYHLIGSELVSRSELSKFLIHSLYAGDLVDRKYVAHHLERGFCTLRVSSSGQFGSPVWIRK